MLFALELQIRKEHHGSAVRACLDIDESGSGKHVRRGVEGFEAAVEHAPHPRVLAR